MIQKLMIVVQALRQSELQWAGTLRMEWNVMEWSGVEWNGMEWNGIQCE